MNPQYGSSAQPYGTLGPPPPPPSNIPVDPPPVQSTFNGFDPHGMPTYTQPGKPSVTPLYSSPPSASQNGPSSRSPVQGPSSDVSITSPPYQQKMVPLPPLRGAPPDQLSQQIGNMHLSQSSIQRLPFGGPSLQQPIPARSGAGQCPPGPPGLPGGRMFHPPQHFNPPVSQFIQPQPPSSAVPQLHFSSSSIPLSSLAQPQYGLPVGTAAPLPGTFSPTVIPSSSAPPSSQYPCSLPQGTYTSQSNFTSSAATLPPAGPGYITSCVQNTYTGPPTSAPPSQANGPISSPPVVGQYPPMPPGQSRYSSTSHSASLQQGQQSVPYQPQYPQPGVGSATGLSQQNRIGSPLGPVTSQPTRRLDPDQMPSPIQVIEEDKKARNGIFYTNTRGQVPPLVTTKFIVQDEGICSPSFIRSTIYSVPCTADMLKQTSVPFSITISPFARQKPDEVPPPISSLSDSGPVRCNRCKAYMCPFMQFVDGGRRFQCIFCKGTTEVPPEYFTHLDHMGQRTDKFERPELYLGSYEFIATKEYCKNGTFPKPPAFIFMMDVSYNSIRNGMVKLLCYNMKHLLAELPREKEGPSEIRVGFVTYSNVVHFYNVKGNLAQPQMLVVSDVQDMFMPLLDGFLVTVQEAEAVIDSLMEQIPQMFADTRETETILGPVIQAGLEALKAADCAGKLFIFHTTLPLADAPGKLRNRDDRKLLGTDKEKMILNPQTTFYNNLGQECVAAGCCVDLFLFPNAYIDVSTLGQVCRLTGGQLYKYTFFQDDVDGARFLEDLKRDLGKPIALDAIMRVRTSTGIRPTDFYGNYFMSNTTDVELAAVDCDKAITVEIKYDDKLVEEDGAYIQSAILYTSCCGQRRLRIHNLALNTCTQMAELFRNCELDAIMTHFMREAIHLIAEQTPRQVKEHFVARSAQMLACYRKNCANPSSAGQLILPECMKLLPLYVNSLTKCDAISGGQEIATDDRSYVMLAVGSMDVGSTACYLYPRLLPLHDIDVNSSELPVALRCSIEKIKDHGVYLLENGLTMFIWIGLAVSLEWIQDVFAVQTVARIDIDKSSLLDLNTPLSKKVREVIEQVRRERQRYMKLVFVRQGDKMELLFRMLLVEDRTVEGSASYVDFLCHLHKEIHSLLT